MFLNTVGFENTAMGAGALLLNLDGRDNTAMGVQALALNDAGSFNTAIEMRRWQAIRVASIIRLSVLVRSRTAPAAAVSASDLVPESWSVRPNNVIAIGNPGDDVDNTIWIGNIYGVSTQSADRASHCV